MKSIILAAGAGNRLEKYTKDMPKCLLNVYGKTLLERQISTLRKAGLKDISIVTGYKFEMIKMAEIKCYYNGNFQNTNMVVSFMKAEREFNEEIIVSYSDIIYEERLLKKLIDSKNLVSVLVDDNWLEYWKAKRTDWKKDIESLKYDKKDNITDIGNPVCDISDMQSRYIGLIKFSKEGINKFKEIFYENKKKFWKLDNPWMRSKSFKKAYMTCMLQEMINRGIEVKAVHVKHGWMEFDTVEDYENVCQWIKDGSIKKYIHLD